MRAPLWAASKIWDPASSAVGLAVARGCVSIAPQRLGILTRVVSVRLDLRTRPVSSVPEEGLPSPVQCRRRRRPPSAWQGLALVVLHLSLGRRIFKTRRSPNVGQRAVRPSGDLVKVDGRGRTRRAQLVLHESGPPCGSSGGSVIFCKVAARYCTNGIDFVLSCLMLTVVSSVLRLRGGAPLVGSTLVSNTLRR